MSHLQWRARTTSNMESEIFSGDVKRAIDVLNHENQSRLDARRRLALARQGVSPYRDGRKRIGR